MTIDEAPTAKDAPSTNDEAAISKDTTEDSNTTSSAVETLVVHEQLFCSLTGKSITAEEAYWAPPLVTAHELVMAVLKTLTHAPGTLRQVLFTEQPNVPYAQDARELLAERRNTEQLKLLVGLLLITALIAAPIFFLAMR